MARRRWLLPVGLALAAGLFALTPQAQAGSGKIEAVVLQVLKRLAIVDSSGVPVPVPVNITGTILDGDGSVGDPLTIPRVGASAHRTTAQTIANDTLTLVTLDAEAWDSDAFHSTSSNTGRQTVPTGRAGVYIVTAGINWAGNGTGQRQLRILHKNAAGTQLDMVVVSAPAFNATHYMVLTYGPAVAAATDYFEMWVYQNSTGNLDLDATGATYRSMNGLRVIRVGD